MMNINLPMKPIYTFPASRGNEITKDYYNFLIGEINRGVIQKAVCRIENKRFGVISYYLISDR